MVFLPIVLYLFGFLIPSSFSSDPDNFLKFRNQDDTIEYKLLRSTSDFSQIHELPLGPLSVNQGHEICYKGMVVIYFGINYTNITWLAGLAEEMCFHYTEPYTRDYNSVYLLGNVHRNSVHLYGVENMMGLPLSYTEDNSNVTLANTHSLVIVGPNVRVTFYQQENYSGISVCIPFSDGLPYQSISNTTHQIGFTTFRSFKFGCDSATKIILPSVEPQYMSKSAMNPVSKSISLNNRDKNYIKIRNQAEDVEYKITGNIPNFSQLHPSPIGPLSSNLGQDICSNGVRCVYSDVNYTGSVGCVGHDEENCIFGSLRAYNSISILGTADSKITHLYELGNYQRIPSSYTTDNPNITPSNINSIIVVGSGQSATFYSLPNYSGTSVCVSVGQSVYNRIPSTADYFGFSTIRSFKFGCN